MLVLVWFAVCGGLRYRYHCHCVIAGDCLELFTALIEANPR